MRRPRINLLRIEEELSEVHLRLTGVNVENLPWDTFIPRYDRPETFFYLDPPYWGIKAYNHNFGPEDFQNLSAALAELKGKFLMSINDTPEIREIFKLFKIATITLRYSANSKGKKSAQELLIRNY